MPPGEQVRRLREPLALVLEVDRVDELLDDPQWLRRCLRYVVAGTSRHRYKYFTGVSDDSDPSPRLPLLAGGCPAVAGTRPGGALDAGDLGSRGDSGCGLRLSGDRPGPEAADVPRGHAG